MKRSDKKNFVQKLKEELSNSSSVIVAHYAGLSVLETDNLRKEMRDNGAKFKVTKNRLTKLALAETPHFSSSCFESSAASTTVKLDKSSIILFRSAIINLPRLFF